MIGPSPPLLHHQAAFSLDYPLLVPKETYVFTATNCVMSWCDSAISWIYFETRLQCQPAQINSSYPVDVRVQKTYILEIRRPQVVIAQLVLMLISDYNPTIQSFGVNLSCCPNPFGQTNVASREHPREVWG